MTDISESARSGELLEGVDEPEISDRAEHLVAFGQFAERAHAPNEHLANAGLFGTSAAIEAMSLCVASDDFDDSLKPHLRSLAFRAWNFIDVAAGLAVSNEKSKYYWQFRCTLRACHVLRAAAAVAPLLPSQGRRGSHHVDEASEDGAVIADFDASVDVVVQTCTKTLLEASQASRKDPGGLPDWMWRFGAEDANEHPLGLVRNTDQAVYLTSSVLIAVVRAWNANVIDDETARQLFPAERRDWLIENLMNTDKAKRVDPRFALFGLWALSHLDEAQAEVHPLGLAVGTKAIQYTVPEHLALGEGFDQDRFVKVIEKTLTAVLDDPTRLVEVQSDYRMVISEYRRDYFVVPVAPTVIMLASRYRPRWLFRRSLGQVLQRILGTGTANSGDYIPYQLAAGTNGVVFMSYLLAASCAARFSMAKMTRTRRFGYWFPAMTQDNGRGVGFLVLLVLLAGPGAFLFVHHHDTALGIWIGAWIGCVFNVLVVPLNARLWGRSD